MHSLPKDDPHGANSTSEKRWAAAATHLDVGDLAAAQKYMEKIFGLWGALAENDGNFPLKIDFFVVTLT